MVFDRADAPNPHLVNRLDEIERFVEHAMIELAVASERTLAFAIGAILGGQHWIKLNDHFWSRHLVPPPRRIYD